MYGDGIGPEIVPPAVAVAKAALEKHGVPCGKWPSLPLGRSAIDSHGCPIPAETLRALSRFDGWLLGPHDSASYPEPHRSSLNPSGTIRKHYNLFANVRPARNIGGTKALAENTNLVVVRENTEGFYADRNTHAGTGEFMPTPDTAIALGIITREAVERIAHVAFNLARKRRKKLTIVHKANVLRLTTGLFRDVCYEVGEQYGDVAIDDYHIDAMTVHLLRRAEDFDVIVTENMFGDILSDMTGELAGSLGIAPSLNSSNTQAMAQAAHGSAPDIAGRGIANPVAMILSVAMLLDWLASIRDSQPLRDAAQAISDGVESVVSQGIATTDLGGNASTKEFAAEVLRAIDAD
jgi:3-isopropylmalate dehydrogenase